MIWYDDVDYPSGSAGGEFKKAYPDDIRKILTRKDSVIPGNTIIEMSVPSGRLMSAVAMNTTSKARIDIRSFVNNRLLKWKSPAGEWKVMTFTCDVASPKLGEDDLRVDYLDPQAVEKYVNYFFSNSTDDMVNTFVHVRGKIIPQLWNPYNGEISSINNFSYIKEGNNMYTRIPLKLGAVQSAFIIAKFPGKED